MATPKVPPAPAPRVTRRLEVRNREEEEEKDTEMSWTLFWQILALMTWAAILVTAVINSLSLRKEGTTDA